MHNHPHLANCDTGPWPERVGQTRPGMACGAGGGPEGATCGECTHYGWSEQRTYTSSKTGEPYPRKVWRGRRCAEFRRLTGKPGAALPETTPACRYYASKEDDP